MIGPGSKVMTRAPSMLLFVCFSLFAADDDKVSVPLAIPAGAPLRLYLTRRISKKTGVLVEAKVMESVFAFDREVIPAGSTVQGDVTKLQPVPKMQRFRAIAAGDLTPLHRAPVEFTGITLPDGRKLDIHTTATEALNSIYVEPRKKVKPPKPGQGAQPDTGVLGLGKSKAREQLNAQLNTRTRGIADIVRGPNKKERLYDFVMAKLPYHPQYIRHGARFDAPLAENLDLGSAEIARHDLAQFGTQPPADSAVRARLLTPLDSSSAKQGDPVEVMVSTPLFSPEHQLLIPAGTRISGAVVVAQKARLFHRGGKLRFTFQKVDLPQVDLDQPERMNTQAIVLGAEPSGKAQIKVDSEGGVKTTESKTRLLAPLVSLVLANKAADNDAGRHTAGGAAEGNVSGRTLGGGLGFGMLGSAVAQSSKWVGMGFGYYGMAWSVYNNIVARGSEVQFDKNAMLDIKFGSRTK